jgi:uncharacterized protein YndB with AHSA1/START domain
MPKFDVTDEAVIDAPPMAVFTTVLNEYAGVTHWWMPYLKFELRGDLPIREGTISDLTAHGHGMPAKFSCKMTKIVKAKSIEMDYAGDFVGTGKWTFEPTDGKTKVQYRFNVRTNRLLFSLVSPFVNVGKSFEECIQKGLKACKGYLSQK